MATFSILEKISEELPERAVESVCEGAEALSLCDIQIVTEGYSKIENQNEKDEKDQPLSSDGNPNDTKQNWSTPQNEHHSSTDGSLTHSHPSQRLRKISVVESSDAVFAERRNIRVFHKKFGESMLSENSKIFNRKL